MLLGCLIVLLAAAGAAAVFALEEVHSLRDAINQNAPLHLSSGSLANAGWGDPQTLLLVGNDQRKHTTTAPVLPHSNEMLLVRLDPSKPWISMMSIPRELMVTIHTAGGPVVTRLNAALTFGGIRLLVNTIRQVTGLPINHVVMIDFGHFVRAVNEIGCVYSTVDRRYYHVNVPGGPQYQQINLQPGYQRMCGTQALQFVSYRHGDTSLVRDARDQDFLLDVKKQYGPTLISRAGEFEHIFGQTVQTDATLHSTNGILNLLGTLISAVNKPVRQVHFQVTLQPTGANPCSCDTASKQQIGASVHDFLHGSGVVHKAGTVAVAHKVHGGKAIRSLPLVAVPASQLGSARSLAAHVPFPLEYPRVQDKGGSWMPVDLRHYIIRAPGGARYPAYVAVFYAGQLGQFYDVQGSPWTTQPELDSPNQSVTVGGRTYYLYYSGQHLQIVAWYSGNDVYWVHNTLTDAIGNGELLAIAEQTVPIGGSAALAAHAAVSLRAAKVPIRLSTTTPTTLRQTLGGIAGLVGLALLVPLLAFLILRYREVRRLRGEMAGSLVSSARLAGGVATLPLPAVRSPRRPSTIPVVAPAASRGLSLRPSVVLAAVVLAAAGAGLGLALTFVGSRAVHGTPRHHPHSHVLRAPAVPVAVLNATSTPGAAARLSRALTRRGVHVSGVGNVGGPRPSGIQILYAPGEAAQARQLAAFMHSQSPRVAPMDPVTAGVAGGAKLAVVIG